MPETVHLVSLRPDLTENGTALLHMEVRARSIQDWAKFGESLQSVPAFDNLIVTSEEKRPDAKANAAEVHYMFTVQYHPEKEGQ